MLNEKNIFQEKPYDYFLKLEGIFIFKKNDVQII
jgi:hypothetical protein